MLKKLRAQVMFSSILPVMGGDFGRNKWAQDVNTWVQDSCLCQKFGVLNHGNALETHNILGPDRIHMSPRGKHIFAYKLAVPMERMERTLNWNWWEKGKSTGLQKVSQGLAWHHWGSKCQWEHLHCSWEHGGLRSTSEMLVQQHMQ